MDTPSANPLAKYFRQPAIYLKLPSEGKFYPPDALERTANGEYPIYPLTARDEITLRTPDALFNGVSVVEVIQSCVPNIKNAWKLNVLDLDAIFIGIRIASYGNDLEIETECAHCKTNATYNLDLSKLLGSIGTPDYSVPVQVSELKIKLQPQNFEVRNRVNMLRFEEKRIIDQLMRNDVKEEEKLASLNAQINKISDFNLEVMAASTEYIQLPDASIVNDRNFILEFYKNSSNTIIKAVEAAIKELNQQATLKPFSANCSNCGKENNIVTTLDYSDFFANGS